MAEKKLDRIIGKILEEPIKTIFALILLVMFACLSLGAVGMLIAIFVVYKFIERGGFKSTRALEKDEESLIKHPSSSVIGVDPPSPAKASYDPLSKSMYGDPFDDSKK